MHADLEGDRIVCKTEYVDRDMIRLTAASHDKDRDVWTMPVTWANCLQLRGIFGQRLEVGAALAIWSQQEHESRILRALEWRDKLEGPVDHPLFAKLQLPLRPFQAAGAIFLALGGNAILADEPGSGKTIQLIAAMTLLEANGNDPFPLLVICPNSIKVTTWQREFAKWRPDLTVSVVDGGRATRLKQIGAGADVTVINWEGIRGHSRLAPYGSIALKHCVECDKKSDNPRSKCDRCPRELNEIGWRTVVADEAHKLQSPTSIHTRAAWAVAQQPTVTRRIAMTGTPLANHVDDYYSILHFVDPVEWPSKTRYLDRYCVTGWNSWGGLQVHGISPATSEEFFRIIDPRMRRMPKDLILPQLPPKVYQTRIVQMSKDERDAYRSMEENMAARVDGGVVMALDPLSKHTRLTRFASAYAKVDEAGNVQMAMPSCKVKGVLEWLEELGDLPAVVAADSRQLIDLMSSALLEKEIPHSMVVGGMSAELRAKAIDDFQDGKVRVILLTMKAGGVGITLTRAGHLGFMHRSGSMVDNAQTEDRVHRIGSEGHEVVCIVDFVAEDTVEADVIESYQQKLSNLEELVRDRETRAKVGKRTRKPMSKGSDA